MHRILDVKPEHESIIVDRVEAHVMKALSLDFPHIDAVPESRTNQFAFSSEESTLITDSGSHTEDVISNPEKKLDSVSDAMSDPSSQSVQVEENIKMETKESDEHDTDVKVIPLERRESKTGEKKAPKTEDSGYPRSPDKDGINQDQRRSREQDERQTPVHKTFIPRKQKNLNGHNQVTIILTILVILAVFVLIYLLFK